MKIKILFFAYVKRVGVTNPIGNMAIAAARFSDVSIIYDRKTELNNWFLDKFHENNIECIDVLELKDFVNRQGEDSPVVFHCQGFSHLRKAISIARPIDKILMSVHCFRNALWYARWVALISYMFFYSRVDMWHFLCSKSREEYFWFKDLPDNTCVFPLGIEELFMSDSGAKGIIKDVEGQEILSENAATIIVYTARFQPWKRHDFLLHSLESILKDNTYLVLIGEGPLREKIMKLAVKLGLRKNVVFTGNIDRDDVHNILSNANLSVSSSTSETFGCCIAEAFCMNVPVVTTDVGIAKSIIVDNQNGFVLDPGCTQAEFMEKTKEALRCFGGIDNNSGKEIFRWETFSRTVAENYESLSRNSKNKECAELK
ncbi:MAG: glycosyltransferase [Candidatus Omnitrophota bacterium]